VYRISSYAMFFLWIVLRTPKYALPSKAIKLTPMLICSNVENVIQVIYSNVRMFWLMIFILNLEGSKDLIEFID
jgi:hypothetical protein